MIHHIFQIVSAEDKYFMFLLRVSDSIHSLNCIHFSAKIISILAQVYLLFIILIMKTTNGNPSLLAKFPRINKSYHPFLMATNKSCFDENLDTHGP